MIFETEDFYVDLVDNQDLNDVVEVYNSNRYFLNNHLGTDKVTYEWILKELEFMKNLIFILVK